MSGPEEKPGGWFSSFRRMSDSLLALGQSRIELFALELQEEKLRAIHLFIWLCVAITLGVAGLLLLLGTLAIFLWDKAGYGGLIGLALVALAGGGALLWSLHRHLRTRPPPFADTIAEFQKDRECLRKPN